MTNTAEKVDVVAFETHARTAAVSKPAPREFGCDVVDQDREPGGKALDRDHQRRPVGLPRRQEPQQGVSPRGMLRRSERLMKLTAARDDARAEGPGVRIALVSRWCRVSPRLPWWSAWCFPRRPRPSRSMAAR